MFAGENARKGLANVNAPVGTWVGLDVDQSSGTPLPLHFPWKGESMSLLRGYNSKSQEFRKSAFTGVGGVLDHALGRGGTSVRSSTSTSNSSADHLDASFSISVGNPLLSVSARGKYTESVSRNADSSKVSTRASIRTGTILPDGDPTLSSEALSLIQRTYGQRSDARWKAFVDAYGDYYVAGMVIGADNAVFFSFSSSKAETLERLNVQVEVHVLCVSAGTEISSFDHAASSRCQITLDGFDSIADELEPTHMTYQPPPNTTAGVQEDVANLKKIARGLLDDGAKLESRVWDGLARLVSRVASDAASDQKTPLSPADIEKISCGGLVVELILLPVQGLREYVRAMYAGPRS